jgi:hypothetical protein
MARRGDLLRPFTGAPCYLCCAAASFAKSLPSQEGCVRRRAADRRRRAGIRGPASARCLAVRIAWRVFHVKQLPARLDAHGEVPVSRLNRRMRASVPFIRAHGGGSAADVFDRGAPDVFSERGFSIGRRAQNPNYAIGPLQRVARFSRESRAVRTILSLHRVDGAHGLRPLRLRTRPQ